MLIRERLRVTSAHRSVTRRPETLATFALPLASSLAMSMSMSMQLYLIQILHCSQNVHSHHEIHMCVNMTSD